MSRIGQTPARRAMLLVAGGLVAFLIGHWTAIDEQASSRRVKEIPPTIGGTALVLDGDTIDFNGLRVRLFGIDAFERDQICERSDGSRYSCGQLAREALLMAIGGSPVTCVRRDVDQFGRMVAVCATRDVDLAAHLVEEGVALAYREFSTDYVDEEERARRAGRGVWDGRFQAPWDYRRDGGQAR